MFNIVLFFVILCANFKTLNKIGIKLDIGALLNKTWPSAQLSNSMKMTICNEKSEYSVLSLIQKQHIQYLLKMIAIFVFQK